MKNNIRRACATATLVAVAALCGPSAAEAPKLAAPAAPRFVEATAAAGLTHAYRDGPSPVGAAKLDTKDPYGADAPGAGAFVVGGGVAALDCNGDSRPDLLIAGGAAPAALFINKTAPAATPGGVAPISLQRIEDPAAALGVAPRDLRGVVGAYAFYWDADAHPDLMLIRFGRNLLLRGIGECRFENASAKIGLPKAQDWTAAFAAYWPHGAQIPSFAFGAYVDRTKPLAKKGNCAPGYLLAPMGARRYGPPITVEPAGCALSMLFVDWAGDGRIALRVANDRQYADPGVGEQLFRLVGPAHAPKPALFTVKDGWSPAIIWGMGLAAADLDLDGKPEIAATSMADNRIDRLIATAAGPSYRNVGAALRALSYRPYVGPDARPSTSWHVAFEDFNNDGALDLWIVKGNVSTMPRFAAFDPNSLLLGARGKDGVIAQFREAGFEAGIAQPGRGRGGAAVDLNGDGLLDLVVVNYEGPTRLFQAIPNGAPQNWLSVRLRQDGPNRAAIGAVIEIQTPDGRSQRRTLRVGGGHVSGSALPAHFGLGAAETARIRIRWPDGVASPWRKVAANTSILLRRAAERK
ncbi:MAG: CRTAC1 family protein [Neomegalonema sp.]|nr:CRTAC1 family protein [Neomegalonema sp.]